MDNPKGCFVLSFDTELAWGYYDRFQPQMYSHDGSQERRSIEKLLSILNEFQISATWAIVGQLFYKNHRESAFNPTTDWDGRFPTIEKMYYEDHPLLFAPDVVEMIANCPTNQEIGCHGHTHTVFDEKQMSPQRAALEINAWKEVAHSFNIEPKTIIFPRNKCGYLDLFSKNGFICYRGTERYPAKIYYSPIIGRFFRRFHYYFSTAITPSCYFVEQENSGLVNIRASHWLFGFNRQLDRTLDSLHLPTLRLYRLINGVQRAAREGKIFHVFAHPCEFKTEYDFKKLSFLLKAVKKIADSGKLFCSTMQDIAEAYLKRG